MHRIARIVSPAFINRVWPSISPLIIESMNPDYRLNGTINDRIHSALLDRSVQLWVLLNDNKIAALAVTSISLQRLTGEKRVVIESLMEAKPLTDTEQKAILDHLLSFGKKNECTQLISYISAPVGDAFPSANGFRANVRMVRKDIV